MLYCCETCGKKFTTEEQALDCEKIHAEEKAKREQLAKAKENRANEIREGYKALNEKCEQYYKDYGFYPSLGCYKEFSNSFDHIFSMIL